MFINFSRGWVLLNYDQICQEKKKNKKNPAKFYEIVYFRVSRFAILYLRSCLYEKNHPTWVRCFTWVRSRQNGVFHFVKTNRLYENVFIPPRWDLTPTQVRSHLGGMIFLHVNSFCWAVPPRRDCSFSLVSVFFYNY